MTPEGRLMREILIATSAAGHRMIRVNAGQGWAGPSVRASDGTVTIRHAQPFHGVPVGVSDLIGACADGVFGAIEVKTESGRVTEPQRRFIEAVLALGGRAGVARSVSDALEILGGNSRKLP